MGSVSDCRWTNDCRYTGRELEDDASMGVLFAQVCRVNVVQCRRIARCGVGVRVLCILKRYIVTVRLNVFKMEMRCEVLAGECHGRVIGDLLPIHTVVSGMPVS